MAGPGFAGPEYDCRELQKWPRFFVALLASSSKRGSSGRGFASFEVLVRFRMESRPVQHGLERREACEACFVASAVCQRISVLASQWVPERRDARKTAEKSTKHVQTWSKHKH